MADDCFANSQPRQSQNQKLSKRIQDLISVCQRHGEVVNFLPVYFTDIPSEALSFSQIDNTVLKAHVLKSKIPPDTIAVPSVIRTLSLTDKKLKYGMTKKSQAAVAVPQTSSDMSRASTDKIDEDSDAAIDRGEAENDQIEDDEEEEVDDEPENLVTPLTHFIELSSEIWDDEIDKNGPAYERRIAAETALNALENLTKNAENLHHLEDIFTQIYSKQSETLEADVLVALGAHLFSPLTGGNQVYVSPPEKSEDDDLRDAELPNCVCNCSGPHLCMDNECVKILTRSSDLCIGSHYTWHGQLDMVAGCGCFTPTPIVFPSRTGLERVTKNPATQKEMKQARKALKDSWERFLSETIVFSFLENNTRKLKPKNYVPSILADGRFFCLSMYNSEDDKLLVSRFLTFYRIDPDEGKLALALENIIALWFILHNEIFFSDNVKVTPAPATGFRRMCQEFNLIPEYERIKGFTDDADLNNRKRKNDENRMREFQMTSLNPRRPAPKKLRFHNAHNF